MGLVCSQDRNMAVVLWVMNGTVSLLTVQHPQGCTCLVFHIQYMATITLTSATPLTILPHRVRWSLPRVPSTGPGHWTAIDSMEIAGVVLRILRFLVCRS